MASRGDVPVTVTYEAVRIRTDKTKTFKFLVDACLWVKVGLAGHVTCVEKDQAEPFEERRSIMFRC